MDVKIRRYGSAQQQEYNANANNQVDPPHLVGGSFSSPQATISPEVPIPRVDSIGFIAAPLRLRPVGGLRSFGAVLQGNAHSRTAIVWLASSPHLLVSAASLPAASAHGRQGEADSGGDNG